MMLLLHTAAAQTATTTIIAGAILWRRTKRVIVALDDLHTFKRLGLSYINV
jgi:hypothetical protein